MSETNTNDALTGVCVEDEIIRPKYNMGQLLKIRDEWKSPVYEKHYIHQNGPLRIVETYFNEFGYTYDICDADWKDPVDGHFIMEINEILLELYEDI